MRKKQLVVQNHHSILFKELRDGLGSRADNNERICPSCELLILQGMPGGRDSVCKNCGYKDPCCYD